MERQIYYEHLQTPADRSPIFYVNITAEITSSKTSKKGTSLNHIYHVENVVVKGTLEEIKASDQTKRQFLKRVFEGKTNVLKAVNEFDFSRIKILKIEIIKGLGYGIKSE